PFERFDRLDGRHRERDPTRATPAGRALLAIDGCERHPPRRTERLDHVAAAARTAPRTRAACAGRKRTCSASVEEVPARAGRPPPRGSPFGAGRNGLHAGEARFLRAGTASTPAERLRVGPERLWGPRIAIGPDRNASYAPETGAGRAGEAS